MDPELRRHVAIPLLLLLAGCAAAPIMRPAPPPVPDAKVETPAQAEVRRARASRPTYNLSGYPPAVREGYIDGCESAKRSPYGRKDAKRFAEDGQYSMGWNDGFAICGRK